jgi:hypothetical protein
MYFCRPLVSFAATCGRPVCGPFAFGNHLCSAGTAYRDPPPGRRVSFTARLTAYDLSRRLRCDGRHLAVGLDLGTVEAHKNELLAKGIRTILQVTCEGRGSRIYKYETDESVLGYHVYHSAVRIVRETCYVSVIDSCQYFWYHLSD